MGRRLGQRNSKINRLAHGHAHICLADAGRFRMLVSGGKRVLFHLPVVLHGYFTQPDRYSPAHSRFNFPIDGGIP